VIAFAIAVDAADALVEAADEVGEVALRRYVGALHHQPAAGGEVGFVGPFLAAKRAGEQALADVADRQVVGEEAGFVFPGHGRSFMA